MTERSSNLSHIDELGNARMVNVGSKSVTDRSAVARCELRMLQSTLDLIRSGGFDKGDVLGVARVAGIMAGKRTSELIPLCHPLNIDQITIDFEDLSDGVGIAVTTTVRTSGKTGVEMEALTSASLTALTIYDMCKSVDRAISIEGLRLLRKSGGKSGDYVSG
ncbi:MAG: cyclic pyranopterin monophosphate synthase MoaC [SAR202 cluster bacterium]|jgi:cyclic pyranopterin phosphate synthase|nr:MAG: cyclic pyranopterin monophosphate synthase MoaC [SAR202 cluster bacterium]MQF64296.1 cyclic pyranopterin monophosphate synthase MoaC [SAR202 cluster bacterium AD-802-L14_MRT_200m]KAA1300251.1 MAG: cyclic pyranopterin monophosphate synthase MoaC [SAR202 cluster bacterium]KAA1305920.1 MAG: cyclic pyranopterin monophosphate synthase MoaC [SAR202 cluster bacterium]MQF64473.1 cyclic pyranopterin monophosphate synthase MoaC [SAR202 cluster bacterium AD-802-L14_MRT_200m]|tara:strand:+ start:57 stop:545 length:489 start_codon:yes stop_codon:yes gene_type:complete